jgi:UDP-N-acetylmuramyl pentapeptide phosphotransferase/UDP-N-acetylglucosamine-1-phosphate transferase
LQGICVYLIFLILLAIFHWEWFNFPLVQGFLLGGTIIVIVELFAELEYMGRIKRKIPPRFRFLVHLLAACGALWISGIADYEFIMFNEVFVLPNRLLYLAFAFWSVFVINAVNRIDGIYAQGNGILTI